MKPTEAQLGTLFRWFRWKMTSDKASKAMKWLENNATRKEVSDEMKRVHDLYHSNKLDEDKCFETPIWQGFHYVEPIMPGRMPHGK